MKRSHSTIDKKYILALGISLLLLFAVLAVASNKESMDTRSKAAEPAYEVYDEGQVTGEDVMYQDPEMMYEGEQPAQDYDPMMFDYSNEDEPTQEQVQTDPMYGSDQPMSDLPQEQITY